MAFDQSTRNRLARFVGTARTLLTEEFTRQLQLEYGLDPTDGAVADLDVLDHLDDARRETARILRDTMNHYLAGVPRQDGKARQDVLTRIVREQAYTVLNRLCALRMAEARDLLIDSVSRGYQSTGFRLYSQLAGTALGETGDAYQAYLFSLFDEFAVDLAVLFDRFSPQGRLFAREATLLRLHDEINHRDIEALWAEDETIGWIYQYFNTDEERRQMRAESQAPRNSRELAVRNQFFTPRYVVEFLTDNTLGRIWYEMTQGQTGLVESCRYLVRRPDEVFLAAPNSDEVAEAQRWLQGEEIPEPDLWALAHTVDGYWRAGPPGDPSTFNWFQERATAVRNGSPTDLGTQELLDMLFLLCRMERFSEGTIDEHELEIDTIRAVLRERVSASRESDRTQEELLRAPVFTPYRPLKDPREITMLDPACGSMHFGLYAFDLYERIYDEAWELEGQLGQYAMTRPEGMTPLREGYASREDLLHDVPRLIIERNIHGIDIDPRAVQIAGLSLWLRAHKSWAEQGLLPEERPQVRRSNIVCAEPMPGDEAQLEAFLVDLEPPVLWALVRVVFDKMKLAGEAGSLLKIEEELRDAVEEAREAYDDYLVRRKKEASYLPGLAPQRATTLFDLLDMPEPERFWEQAEERVLAALEDYADRAANGGDFKRRLFAEDAGQGFAFIDLCRKRYDVVLMNPPFGESIPESRDYLATQYSDASSDLGMLFVSSFGLRLSKEGRLGAITNRTCLATSQLQKWRRVVLLGHNPIVVVADLGYGVLDAAMVETCAYVVTGDNFSRMFPGFRLLESRDKHVDLLNLIDSWRRGKPDSRAQLGLHESFRQLPLAVISYWSPFAMLQKIIGARRLGEVEPGANDGGHTGDDFRFLRLVWEVSSERIGRQADYVFFAKGGEYSPMWDDVHLLEYWQSSGKEIREIPGARIYHEDLHFRPGLTYPLRTTSDISPRVLPEQCMFSTGGHGIHFHNPQNALAFLGLSYTRVVKVFVEILFGGGDASVSGSAARNYTAGTVNMLPFPSLPPEVVTHLSQTTRRLIKAFQLGFASDETSRYFTLPQVINPSETLIFSVKEYLLNEIRRFRHIASEMASIEEVSLKAFGLDLEDIEGTLDLVYGNHPNNYVYRDVTDELPALLDDDLSSLMNKAAEAYGARNRSVTKKSYFIDRTIDLACHVLQTSPTAICDSWEKSVCVPVQTKLDLLAMLLQYVLGASLGRWDIRFARGEKSRPDPPVDPFTPLPICPPGMLKNAQSLPARPDDVPSDYPLRISWQGILVEDESHPEDIESRALDGLRAIWQNRTDAVEREACEMLGVSSLRVYFGDSNRFFADHLKRYSKSRRQAPIYWPLSTPSGSYTLWLYYHRLSDQIFYSCVNDFVDPKLKDVIRDVRRLRQEASRDRDEERELERLSDLELELQDFRAELLRIAAFWRPNLNDGVQITAAPLWRLFRHRAWQKRLRETWEKLKAGDYDWAHLAMSIWPERVVPKCVGDRSLAIAHGVEELFWVEEVDGWRVLREPEDEIADQKARQCSSARKRLRVLLEELADGPAKGVSTYQVCQHLAEGDWDDMEIAARLWPERLADKCWDEPLLAPKVGVRMPQKRTKAARKRFLKELQESGTPELAEALVTALCNVEEPFDAIWAGLARGDRDKEPLALALWPDRVVDKCASDAELAERQGLRRFFWVRDTNGEWRRRKRPRREVVDEIERRSNRGTKVG